MSNLGNLNLSIEPQNIRYQQTKKTAVVKSSMVLPKKIKRECRNTKLARVFLDFIDECNKSQSAKRNQNSQCNGPYFLSGCNEAKSRLVHHKYCHRKIKEESVIPIQKSPENLFWSEKETFESLLVDIRANHLAYNFLMPICHRQASKEVVERQTPDLSVKSAHSEQTDRNVAESRTMSRIMHISACYMMWNVRTGGFLKAVDVGKRRLGLLKNERNKTSMPLSVSIIQPLAEKCGSHQRKDNCIARSISGQIKRKV